MAVQEGPPPAAVILHHPGKNESLGPRGTSAIDGDFDWIVSTSCVGSRDDTPLEERVYEMKTLKVKDGRDDRTWAYGAALIQVGTRMEDGKQLYAPVVRAEDLERVTAFKAEERTKGQKLTPTVKRLVELITRIEGRDGKPRVPLQVLNQSGYLDREGAEEVTEDRPVTGIPLQSLRDAVYAEDEEVGRSPDGQRTVPDKCRKRWERKRDALISSGMGWVCDGWVWLVNDEGADGDGR